MIYPRVATINGKEILVNAEQMVGWREHLTQEHRTLFLSGIIGMRCVTCGMNDTASQNRLVALDSLSNDPIKLFIDSPGGDLDTTFLFYDTMKLIKSPVITIGRYCVSAAALILAGGSERYLFPHAKVMLHPHRMAFGGGGMSDNDLEVVRQESRKYKEGMIDILLECGARKDRQSILSDIENKDFWLAPKEAIEYGLADEIITSNVWREMWQ